MKNFYFMLVVLLVSISIFGQEKPVEEFVIYANSTKNSSLIFPTPIKKAVVGSENFKFGYNKTELSNIGILKATLGEESNLLIITENGNIFSFVIRYKKDNNLLTYFIKENMAVGNEKGNIVLSETPEKQKSEKESVAKPNNMGRVVDAITVNNFQTQTVNDTTHVYKKLCLGEIDKPIFYNRIYGTKDKVTVKLKNISYLENELYFTVILKNESTLDYDINYLNFYITSRNKKKNTTTQTIPYKSKYIHNLPTKIKAGENIEVVYVYQKFSINENKILLIEMTEDNGERNVKLEIPNTFINNPN